MPSTVHPPPAARHQHAIGIGTTARTRRCRARPAAAAAAPEASKMQASEGSKRAGWRVHKLLAVSPRARERAKDVSARVV